MMKERILEVAKDLLATLGESLTPNSRLELMAVVDGSSVTDRCSACVSHSGGDTSFWGGDAQLSVGFEGADTEIDESGDLYRTYNMSFNVSWSSHNKQASGTTLQMLSSMMYLSETALAFSQKYAGPIRILSLTAAQREQNRLDAEKAMVQRKVKTIAEYVVKGLRANGNHRDVDRSVFTGIPDGMYNVAYRMDNGDVKKYTVKLFGSAKVWRTL